MKTKNLLIRCEPSLLRQIKSAKKSTKLAQAEVVRQALNIGIPQLLERLTPETTGVK